MTIGPTRGDWLRRMRAEMRESAQPPTPIIMRFSATDTPSPDRRPAPLPISEGLLPPAILVPAGAEAMPSWSYARR